MMTTKTVPCFCDSGRAIIEGNVEAAGGLFGTPMVVGSLPSALVLWLLGKRLERDAVNSQGEVKTEHSFCRIPIKWYPIPIVVFALLAAYTPLGDWK